MSGLVPLAVLLLTAVACSGGPDAGSWESLDSAGVRIVLINASNPLAWDADTVRVVGGEESGALGFYRVRPELVDVDTHGRIYVLDQASKRVVVLDTTGQVQLVLGREGGGPGELLGPLGVAVSASGVVLVHDGSKGSVVRFAPGGEPLTEVSFTFSTINNRLRHVDVVGEDIAAWTRDRYTGSDDRNERLIALVGQDTVELIAVGMARSSTAQYPACNMTFTIPVPLSPSIRWDRAGERMAVSVWGEDRVDLFDGLRRTVSVRFQPPRPEVDDAEVIRLLEELGYRGPCNANAREVVRKHGFFPLPQHVRAVAVAPDNGVWVRRQALDGPSRIDVVDSLGVPVGQVPDGFPMPIAFLPDGRLIIQVRDSLDVERLGIVRVRQGAANR